MQPWTLEYSLDADTLADGATIALDDPASEWSVRTARRALRGLLYIAVPVFVFAPLGVLAAMQLVSGNAVVGGYGLYAAGGGVVLAIIAIAMFGTRAAARGSVEEDLNTSLKHLAGPGVTERTTLDASVEELVVTSESSHESWPWTSIVWVERRERSVRICAVGLRVILIPLTAFRDGYEAGHFMDAIAERINAAGGREIAFREALEKRLLLCTNCGRHRPAGSGANCLKCFAPFTAEALARTGQL